MTKDINPLENPYGTALGLMDEVYGAGTVDALKAHGGPYESWQARRWRVFSPSWVDASVYRVRPQPLTKPTWPAGLADWVQWIARDEDGELRAFAEKPWHCSSMWISPPRKRFASLNAVNIDPGTCDWRDSLVQRPEGM